MGGVVDKFKRKLIHRICDRYSIHRTFVDKNSGNILLVKIPESKIPKILLEDLYKKYNEEKEKITEEFGNLKLNLKTRDQFNLKQGTNTDNKKLNIISKVFIKNRSQNKGLLRNCMDSQNFEE